MFLVRYKIRRIFGGLGEWLGMGQIIAARAFKIMKALSSPRITPTPALFLI